MEPESNKLVPGEVDAEHFAGLLRLTKITGEKVISALHAHLVKGQRQADVCRVFEILPGQLSRKIADLNKVSGKVRPIAKFYR